MPATETAHTEPVLRKRAMTRLKEKRDFRLHLCAYFAVNAMLLAIWALGDRGPFWPIFPMLGWGIGVVANAWVVHGRKPIGEDAIRREIGRLRRGI